jgi:hypothetical protein
VGDVLLVADRLSVLERAAVVADRLLELTQGLEAPAETVERGGDVLLVTDLLEDLEHAEKGVDRHLEPTE